MNRLAESGSDGVSSNWGESTRVTGAGEARTATVCPAG